MAVMTVEVKGKAGCIRVIEQSQGKPFPTYFRDADQIYLDLSWLLREGWITSVYTRRG